ncbi:MAG: ATP-binding protein, partial [Bdellovibrionales bacterium]|nr:ATP-binding protein [Bdellovibrionales bacterium]
MPNLMLLFGTCTTGPLTYRKIDLFSFLVQGGTGKTELLSRTFSAEEAEFIDLLDPELESRLSAHPGQFNQILDALKGKKSVVVIDEIQKVPSLLEIVHQRINKKEFIFALTGSSARKLKRGGANLLAGRAFVFNLFSLSERELGDDFQLTSVLQYGSLPEIFHYHDEISKRRYLKAYTQTYLAEEIIAEQIVRNLPPFRRFLEVAASADTQMINYSNFARDIDSDPKTVSRYFGILEDTLLGFHLPAYSRSVRKQQRNAKKFYFFDTGVVRTLSQLIDEPLTPRSYGYGRLFESLIVNEIHKQLHYKEKQFKLSYLNVSDSQEIDLIVEIGKSRVFACEIKSSERIDARHIKNLKTLAPDIPNAIPLVICNAKREEKIDDIRILPWRQAIREICS